MTKEPKPQLRITLKETKAKLKLVSLNSFSSEPLGD